MTTQILGIPGTFISDHVRKLRFVEEGNFQNGEITAKRYIAKVFDGVLGLLVSQDPAGRDGKLLWHISLSHRNGWRHSGEEVITRLPTWDELKYVKYTFAPPGVVMALLLPAAGQPYVDDFPTCLHLWEVPRELAD